MRSVWMKMSVELQAWIPPSRSVEAHPQALYPDNVALLLRREHGC